VIYERKRGDRNFGIISCPERPMNEPHKFAYFNEHGRVQRVRTIGREVDGESSGNEPNETAVFPRKRNQMFQ
jgi:hypothetical protein